MTDDLISREALKRRMYHDSFEIDNGMQKWDSGLWIRFKLFENVLADIKPADVVEVVRCKNCRFWKTETEPTGIECQPGETAHYCCLTNSIVRTNDFCSYGERKECEE